MLNDLGVRALSYDAATDEARLEVEEAGEPSGAESTVEGQLLLDAAGFLVGVDLGGEGLARAVAMLGPHEKVDRTLPAKLAVRADASGRRALIVIRGAKAAIRGAEKSPYAR
jgi:hypothetical protein